ncbi:DUF1214 domain-containing protein [Zavarzinia compransoris]|nr:DUF1214 domain-containing protein [Zavarzinia compransoris]TDP48808.1 hypothetical protein DES42_101166 [Zavarzinia compransoris]
MRRIIVGFVLLVLGAALGLGSAWAGLNISLDRTATRVGAWQTPLDAGGTDRGLYTRAVVALGALLALSRSETIYFIARADDQGEPLRGNCTYELSGRDLPARWWSVTLYAGDHFLIANPEQRWSFNDANLAREADGSFRLTIARDQAPGNWLPSGTADRLVLLARLYNPQGTVATDPATAVLPTITRKACS